jgi:hypothetical protein
MKNSGKSAPVHVEKAEPKKTEPKVVSPAEKRGKVPVKTKTKVDPKDQVDPFAS